jgi:uncharacterized protein (TIGR02453 family)
MTILNLEPILNFLDELSQNNNKIWFESHRPAYNTARSIFEDLVTDLIEHVNSITPLPGLTARECIARIYRDIRFSKDKSPYKTNMAAHIAPGGWNTTSMGYYISLEPHGESLVGSGLHDPSPEQLNRFRQAIEADADEFKRIINADSFIELFGAVEGDRLKTVPKGYERTHPDIALLQLKQIMVVHHFTDGQVLAADFVEGIFTACKAMKPFVDYLERFI